MEALTIERLIRAFSGNTQDVLALLSATTGWQFAIHQSTLTFLLEGGVSVIVELPAEIELPRELIDLANGSALTGSIYVPLVWSAAGVAINFAFSSSQWCYGAGPAVGLGASWSAGSLTAQSGSNIEQILPGFAIGMTATAGSYGYQFSAGSSGAAQGYAIGTPGVNLGVSWSSCKGY